MNPEISTIDLLQLASGDRLSLQVYKFKGATPGKKAYLQSNLHGSEIVGNAVIDRLIQFFASLDNSQILGEIWLVPVCNPLSTNHRSHFFSTGRYNSYDGKDWNRIFWDYEKECEDLAAFAKSQLDLEPQVIRKNFLDQQKKSFKKQLDSINSPSSVEYNKHYRYQLQTLCLDANYVIDIHSSSNQGTDYLYCFESREESANYLLFEYGILMNEYDGDAFDEAFMKPWLALEKHLAQLGKEIQFDIESWTLELGSGMQINPQSVERGVSGIKNYLAYKGMLDLPNLQQLDSTKTKLFGKSNLKKYYAPNGGMIQNRVALNNQVKAGEPLYQILTFNKKQSPTAREICAEADGLVFDISTNEAVNQGEYVLSMMND